MLLNILLSILSFLVAAKGDTEPERNETRSKVDEDRKHEYPFGIILLSYMSVCFQSNYFIKFFSITSNMSGI